MDFTYGPARTDQDLRQILAIQEANLPEQLSADETREQGFVTVRHDLDLLREMNHPHAHAVARHHDRVVGYALVMQRAMGDRIPVLYPLFERIDDILWHRRPLSDYRYFVMGQVAIDRPYRGRGIFPELFREFDHRLAEHYDLTVTEIATRNVRSCRAHAKAGFKDLHTYHSPDGEEWVVVARRLASLA